MPVLTGRLSRANPQSHLERRKQGWGREKALNLSVSAPLTNCNVATCWHVELSTLNLLLLWLNIYLSNSFSSSIHVFHSKIALGLALGESWGVACATTEKQWCPVSTESTSTCFRGKAFLQANLHKAGCRKTLMSKEYTYACFGGQAFQGQTRNLNQSHLGRGKQGWGRGGGGSEFVCLCTADKLWCGRVLARWTQHAQPSPPLTQHLLE